MSHTLDAAKSALFCINALRVQQGREPFTLAEVGREDVQDALTDLLHLAAHIEREDGGELEVEDYAERAVRAWQGDMAEDQGDDPMDQRPGVIALHGSPMSFEKGETLRPGPAYHHVFAVDAEHPTLAEMWAKVKAGSDGTPHVYRVRMGDDAFESGGHILSTTATVIAEATEQEV